LIFLKVNHIRSHSDPESHGDGDSDNHTMLKLIWKLVLRFKLNMKSTRHILFCVAVTVDSFKLKCVPTSTVKMEELQL